MKKFLRHFFNALLCAVLCISAFVALVQHEDLLHRFDSKEEDSSISSSALFVGDIMLARSVENLMRKNGSSYPFKSIQDFLKTHAHVVGNFEGSIPLKHSPTPPMTFAFSVDQTLLQGLTESGVTNLSLANNHSYDYGSEAYAHTQEVLRENDFTVGGDQRSIGTDDVMYVNIGSLKMAILPLYAVYFSPKQSELETVLASASKESDVQMVYVHWGNEYELVHSAGQELLAHRLIDAGVDLIIGHHPHVVQDVGMYKNAPIFYSLGNFVFDQYWNEDVQTGLMVELTSTDDIMRYTLVPVKSSKSVPDLLDEQAKSAFLKKLANRSNAKIQKEIVEGSFEINLAGLATKPQ